ncbi:MAG: acyl carrier protein [Acutalibacteraceae bacterium]|jgi:acyl carrier protein|nr:acyl carrier protein [Clostridiales bacterium]
MVLEKVISIMADHLNMDEDDITEELTFEELGADEMDVAEIVLALESEFEIEILDEEVMKLNEVNDLVDIIETAIELG